MSGGYGNPVWLAMGNRVAAIDCGTNSIKILIAEASPSGLVEVVRDLAMVRLGEGVDQTGRLSPAAVSRTLAGLEKFQELITTHQVNAVRMCATSATRDAENSAEFSAAVQQIIGVVPEVLSGAEEAKLSYLGAISALPKPVEPTLVVDIGGGSTEFIFAKAGNLSATSLNIGSVRLTERLQLADPPTATQIKQLGEEINTAFAQLPQSIASAKQVICVAGTWTTVAAHCLNLSSYQRDRIHRARLPVATALPRVQQLLELTVAERKALPYMHPNRADVIGAGAAIAAEILRQVTVDQVYISEADLLDGIALSLVEERL